MLETIGGKYTIKQIFKDNWTAFFEKNKADIRPAVIENVDKMLDCGDIDKMGYNLFSCPCCGVEKFVPHTCKSRFCNSCGKVMTDSWIKKAQSEFLNVPYYHIIFSPPCELWWLFRSQSKVSEFSFSCG